MLISLARSWATTLSRNPRRFSTAATMARDYNAAVTALNTLQSNFAIVDAIRKSGLGMNKNAIPEMLEWFRKAGYEPSDFDRLKPIHIAGTKGKGSTSAFVSSILAQYHAAPASAPVPRKIGLYTSPHLKSVRERIQINNTPLSEEAFAKYFFEIWDRLEAAARAEGKDPSAPGTKPVYFRFLTIMALHAYLREGVDAAVIECGIGGEHDSTNVIVKPTVTAVTSLGIDHVAMLGGTLPEIAWHKAGIFKPGAAALSVPQSSPEAMQVLRDRAAEKGVELVEVPRHPDVDAIRLGLAADFQKTNASLAVAIAASHLRALGDTSMPASAKDISSWALPAEFRRGLEQVRWPGRCEIRREPGVAWHIDGAHTLDSIEVAGRWFAEEIAASSSSASSTTTSASSKPRILIFNQQTRDAASLARALYAALAAGAGAERHPFTHAVFTTNLTFQDTGYKPDLVSVNTNADDVEKLAVQEALARTWSEIDPQTEVKVVRTIEEAVRYARGVAAEAKGVEEGEEVKVLITGSLHLVGGALEVLDSK
ncbi:Folylpolyglutamate synthetase [Lasiodiplodia theobromae]|uniref:Folylpolyglutamate synthetase n=1 Tax=Lasiodiplodia theobromae TaxID=45133 RepID=UPI0015C30AEB|nr:Folylpolyglutamate synthetase [Lasiodiplodia theobromae]KAF4546074.1 Folylpolyglutamate synthetase [Lasiodiplodia theobromae]